MINQELIHPRNTAKVKQVSHWYCDSSKIDHNFILGMNAPTTSMVQPSVDQNYWTDFSSKCGIKADLIYYIQQNIKYYLKIEEATLPLGEVVKTIVKDDNLQTISYEKISPMSVEDDIFTIVIPNRKVNLKVSKCVLMKESKVFERMLNTQMIEATTSEMTIDHTEKYFEWMIEYIHTGYLGIDQYTFENELEIPEKENVTMEDLLGLLSIADEYQVESLTRSISKTCNMYNALTISLYCLELSEDCKSIINEEALLIISGNIGCVVCDPIFRKVDYEDLEMDPSRFLSMDKEDLTKEVIQRVPFLKEKDVIPIIRYIGSKQAHNKIIGKIPFELFKAILLNILSNEGVENNFISLLMTWTVTDYQERFEESCKLILEFVDFSQVGEEDMFALYTVLANAGDDDQFYHIKSQLKDHMLKAYLSKTGIPKQFLRIKEKKIEKRQVSTIHKNGIMIGLDNSGKTTILYNLRLGEAVSTIPTAQFNSEIISFQNIEFAIKDFGGAFTNNLWKEHVQHIQFVILVIDSNDVKRMSQVKELITSTLEIIPTDCPILFLANKQDLVMSLSVANIVAGLGLNSIFSDRKWYIQACFALGGDGLNEGLEWLSSNFVASKVVQHFGTIDFHYGDFTSIFELDKTN